MKPDNLIDFSDPKRLLRDVSRGRRKPSPHVIAVTSGKGGVGKTNIVANTGFALSRLGKKTMILDADLGLGNLDVLLGLSPKYDLSHFITGQKALSEVIVKGPGEMMILPASSGIQEMTHLKKEQQFRIIQELDTLIDPIDILLVDTAAGISANVMYFNSAARDVIIVVAPEPASMTDAYAMMKVLSLRYSGKRFKILVNLVAGMQEADEVFQQLRRVTDEFLDISIEYFGCVLYDAKISIAARERKLVSEKFPDSISARCFQSLAKRICRLPLFFPVEENRIWNHFSPDPVSF